MNPHPTTASRTWLSLLAVRTAAACVVMVFVSAASAQPLADRMPDDALAYVGWAGADHLGPDYERSHAKAVLDASNLRAVFEEFLPRLMNQAGEAGLPDELSRLGPILSVAWKHPTALYVGPVAFGDAGNNPQPRLALYLSAGGEAEKVETALKQAVEDAPDDAKVAVVRVGEIVILTVGDVPNVVGLLAGENPEKTLARSAGFAEAMKKLDARPVFAVYVNVGAVAANLDMAAGAALLKNPRDEDAKAFRRAMDLLDVKNIRRFAMTAGFDGADFSCRAWLDYPAPRKGIVAALLDPGPLSDNLLRSVPASATTLAAARFDAGRLFDEIKGLIDGLGPEARHIRNDFEEGLAEFKEATGLDLRADLLGSLGADWAVYFAPEVGGNGILGLTAVNRLTDAEKAKNSLAKLVETANKMGQDAPPGRPRFTIRRAVVDGLDIDYMGIPVVSPAWTIAEGKLYAALYPQVAASAAARTAKSIVDDAQFKTFVKSLAGDNRLTSVEYLDLPKTAPEGYQLALMLSQVLLGAADMMGMEAPSMVIPPYAKLAPHLSPAGSVTWTDATGWHYRSRSPFPGASLLAGPSGAATMLMGLLPVLGYSMAAPLGRHGGLDGPMEAPPGAMEDADILPAPEAKPMPEVAPIPEVQPMPAPEPARP